MTKNRRGVTIAQCKVCGKEIDREADQVAYSDAVGGLCHLECCVRSSMTEASAELDARNYQTSIPAERVAGDFFTATEPIRKKESKKKMKKGPKKIRKVVKQKIKIKKTVKKPKRTLKAQKTAKKSEKRFNSLFQRVKKALKR